MINYKLIDIPANLRKPFLDFSEDEVNQYFEWFMQIKSTRLAYFLDQTSLRIMPNEVNKNLTLLYDFLKGNQLARDCTSAEIDLEMKRLPNHLKSIHKTVPYVFVEPYYSMCFDAWLYFSECLINEMPLIKWWVERDIESVYYGRMILVKDGINKAMCPSWLFYIFTAQIYEGDSSVEKFLNLYENWKDNFKGEVVDYMALVNSLHKKSKGSKKKD